jgi:hypothetical protein
MKIRWSQLDGKLVYDSYFYQSLLRNFETLGQSEDWRAAYYEYHVEKRKQLPLLGFRRPLEWVFLEASCGYGVKPIRPPLVGFLIVFLFAFLYYPKEAIEQTCSEAFPMRETGFFKPLDNISKHYKNALYFSASTFLALSYGDWSPSANFLKIGPFQICRFRTIAIIEAFFGWIILVLLVITITMTWMR